jgi:hypothetical protein
MKNRDASGSDQHSYWIHFWRGLVCGAVFGAVAGMNLFESSAAMAATATLAAGITACSCGHWGEQAWEYIFEMLTIFF